MAKIIFEAKKFTKEVKSTLLFPVNIKKGVGSGVGESAVNI